MSRLIFEGDTTDRFGKLFPKPFIEEIRALNEIAEIDIALYFQINLEHEYGDMLSIDNNAERADIEQFMRFMGIDDLKIHPGFMNKESFDNLRNTDGNIKIQSLITEYLTGTTSGPGFITAPAGSGPTTLIEIEPDYSFFYNSEGKKFVKFSFTMEKNYQSFLDAGLETILFCITFYKFDEEILSSSPLKNSQYSAISYEHFLNSDGNLDFSSRNIFIDSSGVFYGQTPIKTLAGQYKTSSPIGHKEISNIVQQEIAPYVNSVSEADMISFTLQEFSDDPDLLIKLKQNAISFTNKSSVNVTGTLYLRLVDIISNLDSLIQEQETLRVRRAINKKIINQTEQPMALASTSAIQGAPEFNINNDQYYIKAYAGSRQFIPIINTTKLTGDIQNINEEVAIVNKSYHFFDYERAINYQSQISRFFNIYNLYQIFNSRGINQFYKISRVVLRKTMVDVSSRSGATGEDEIIERNLLTMGVDLGDESLPVVETNGFGVPQGLPDVFKEMLYKKIATGCLSHVKDYEGATTLANKALGQVYKRRDSHIVERAFDTVKGDYRNYRMKFYEVVEFETGIQSGDRPLHQLRIFVNDTSMQFYFHNIYAKIIVAFAGFEQYATLAEEFCSYNNIDGRFNDFFVQAVEERFIQPYPWLEAPLIYYSFKSLLEASYNDLSDFSNSNRKRDGTIIDETLLKDLIKIERAKLSPITGDLESVRSFVNKFRELREIFLKNSDSSYLDGARIFVEGGSTEGIQLKHPEGVDKFYTEKLNLGAASNVWDYFDLDEEVIEDPAPENPRDLPTSPTGEVLGIPDNFLDILNAGNGFVVTNSNFRRQPARDDAVGGSTRPGDFATDQFED